MSESKGSIALGLLQARIDENQAQIEAFVENIRRNNRDNERLRAWLDGLYAEQAELGNAIKALGGCQ